MSVPPSACQPLQREFLGLRARLIELAAGLDRIRRGEGSAEDDPRWTQLQRAIERLGWHEAGLAEQMQMLFSLPYDPDWRTSPLPPGEGQGAGQRN